MPKEPEDKKNNWLASIDLPPWLKSRALKAIDGLVGEIGESVSSKFERSRKFDEAINDAAIARAISEDSPFVAHALNQHAARVTRFQRNREKIAKKAAEYIVQNRSNSSEEGDIDHDWTDVFGSYSERVTNEVMQDLWAKVLSGEIQKPGTFSRSTLRTISEMSVSDANFVAKIRPSVLVNAIIGHSTDEHGFFKKDYIRLEALGVLLDARTGSAKKFQIENKDSSGLILHSDHVIQLKPSSTATKCVQVYSDKTFLTIPTLLLSKQGEELLSLLPEPSVYETASHIKNVLGDEISEVKVFKVKTSSDGQITYDKSKGMVI